MLVDLKEIAEIKVKGPSPALFLLRKNLEVSKGARSFCGFWAESILNESLGLKQKPMPSAASLTTGQDELHSKKRCLR